MAIPQTFERILQLFVVSFGRLEIQGVHLDTQHMSEFCAFSDDSDRRRNLQPLLASADEVQWQEGSQVEHLLFPGNVVEDQTVQRRM